MENEVKHIEEQDDKPISSTESVVQINLEVSEKGNPIEDNEKKIEECSLMADYKDILSHIDKLNLYSQDKKELLEIIQQYNRLCSESKEINQKLKIVKEDVVRANDLYDSLKRSFAQIVEDSNFGEKLYMAIPIIDEYHEDNEWDNLWCKTIQEAVSEENREAIKKYLDGKLFCCTFSLPKDVYYYKLNETGLENINADVMKKSRILASKMILMFKFMKDVSEQLRVAMLKAVCFEKLEEPDEVDVLPELELEKDQVIVKDLIENSISDYNIFNEKDGLYNKYCNSNNRIETIIDNPEDFRKLARELYQKVEQTRNDLKSLGEVVYSASLNDLFKLVDFLKKIHNDYRLLKEKLDDVDETSLLYCAGIMEMLMNLLDAVCSFLRDALKIEPLGIEIGSNFNDYDVNWYKVIFSDDAPSEKDKECVYEVSEIGFGRLNDKGEIENVVREAQICVYSKYVVSSKEVVENPA